MPTRWKLAIGSVILFVWAGVYVLWDLMNRVGIGMPLRETQWAPSDMKKVWVAGILAIAMFVFAIVGDVMNRPSKAPGKPESPAPEPSK